ncbi:MAG: cytochrome c1 [Sphingomicrobium sp.]
MVRIIGFLVGLGFAGILMISMATDLTTYFTSTHEATAEHEFHLHPRDAGLPTDGLLGTFDKAQLQRGLKVYTEVCSGCHAISRVHFYDLQQLGYNEGQVKSYAANEWKIEVPSINPDTGEAATRKATPADFFPSPYANEVAARAANNNALPPDLSLMAKARHDGANYIYSLLTGYRNQPAELLAKFPAAKTPQGLHYNPYFANLNLAMPAPLTSEGQVSYEAEGSPKPTVDQMAKDVSAFLQWTAEPKLGDRKRAGLTVLIFLLIATVLGYMAYQNVWAEAKRKVAAKGPLEPENKTKRNRAKNKAGIEG